MINTWVITNSSTNTKRLHWLPSCFTIYGHVQEIIWNKYLRISYKCILSLSSMNCSPEWLLIWSLRSRLWGFLFPHIYTFTCNYHMFTAANLKDLSEQNYFSLILLTILIIILFFLIISLVKYSLLWVPNPYTSSIFFSIGALSVLQILKLYSFEIVSKQTMKWWDQMPWS